MQARKSFLIATLVFGYCLIIVAVVFSVDAIKPLPRQYMKNINQKVQLQENEWVKIVDSSVYEETPEEVFHKQSDDPFIIEHKQDAKKRGYPVNGLRLQVKIQFFHYCMATTLPAPKSNLRVPCSLLQGTLKLEISSSGACSPLPPGWCSPTRSTSRGTGRRRSRRKRRKTPLFTELPASRYRLL